MCDGLDEIAFEGTIGNSKLRDFETIFVSGLDEEKSFYLQINVAL